MAHEWAVGVLSGESSWHRQEDKYGELIPNGANYNIFEGLQKYGADYTVEKVPIGATAPDGTFVPDTGRFSVLRPPTTFSPEWERMRIVGNRYEVIQNSSLAHIVQPMIDSGWEFAGWAILKAGKIFFIQLKLGEWEIGGYEQEHHKNFLLISNDHSQGNAFWGETNVRTVCYNTYSWALAGGIEAIPHVGNTELQLDFRSQIQTAALRFQQEQRDALENMFRTPVNGEQVNETLEHVFPNPQPSKKMLLAAQGRAVGVDNHEFLDVADADTRVFNQKTKRAEDLRTSVRDAFGQFNDEFPYAGNTAYALFQSVTNVTNHSPLYTGSEEKNLISLHYGNKAKTNQTAFEYISALK